MGRPYLAHANRFCAGCLKSGRRLKAVASALTPLSSSLGGAEAGRAKRRGGAVRVHKRELWWARRGTAGLSTWKQDAGELGRGSGLGAAARSFVSLGSGRRWTPALWETPALQARGRPGASEPRAGAVREGGRGPTRTHGLGFPASQGPVPETSSPPGLSPPGLVKVLPDPA